jgi:hypothetical protein
MTIQTGNLGTAPSGAGGDTFRSFAAKMNENFTNNTHAASRYVGTAADNVMEVGAFGVGSASSFIGSAERIAKGGFFAIAQIQSGDGSLMPAYQHTVNLPWVDTSMGAQIVIGLHGSAKIGFRTWDSSSISYFNLLHNANTTTDSNGFIKKASPIIKLFADKIEPNDEASEQNPVFEKLDIGHYLLKNTEGFSDDGWYIEIPKDANGNVLVAVQYQQLEDNTIEVKTFAKKFDEETGDIVPNLEKPRDIPAGRWIDIRLKELLKPEIEISNTPPEFQPTNLAQAVAEALKDDAEQ